MELNLVLQEAIVMMTIQIILFVERKLHLQKHAGCLPLRLGSSLSPHSKTELLLEYWDWLKIIR